MFDTPAVFARDIRDLDFFVRHWCDDGLDKHNLKFPTSIIFPTDYFETIHNHQQKQILETFVNDIAACFNINIRKFSLQQMWQDNPPLGANGQDLHAFLHEVGRNSFFFDFYQSTDDFRRRYFAKHQTSPPVNNMTGFRWEVGSSITHEQRLDAGRRLEVYKDWLLEEVLCGDYPIMLLPIMNVVPNYRDDQRCGPAIIQEAWDQLWLSPVLRAPEVTVPSE